MRTLVVSAFLAVVLVGGACAQGPQQGGANPAQTAKVVTALADMFAACGEVSETYRPDCLSRALQRGAGKITNNPGYWEADVALTRASRRLTQLVRENTDPDAGRHRVQGYRVKAVEESRLPTLRVTGGEILARLEEDLEMLPQHERDAFAPIATVVRTRTPWP